MALFVAIALGGLSVDLVERFGKQMSPPNRQFLQTIIQTFSFHGLGLLLVTSFIIWQKFSWKEAFGLNNSTPKRVLAFGICAGILVLPFAWGFQELSILLLNYLQVDATPQEIIQRVQSTQETVPHKYYLFFTAVFLAPVNEEVLFRGVFYPALKQLGFPRLALWGMAFVFAAFHVNAQSFFPLFFFALVLTWLYEQTDNLLTPIIAHSIFNTANFILLLYKDPITEWFKTLL